MRFLCFLIVTVVAAFGVLYSDALAIEREYLLAKKRHQAQPNPGRIWSQKCMRQGKRILATQADGGRWQIRCVSGAPLKV